METKININRPKPIKGRDIPTKTMFRVIDGYEGCDKKDIVDALLYKINNIIIIFGHPIEDGAIGWYDKGDVDNANCEVVHGSITLTF